MSYKHICKTCNKEFEKDDPRSHPTYCCQECHPKRIFKEYIPKLVRQRICQECNEEFLTTQRFKKHIKQVHNLSLMEYTIKFVYDGIHPTCACGCGQKVTWQNDQFFVKLIKGHVTQEIRDNVRNRLKNIPLTKEHKDNISKSSKEFFQTEEGIVVKRRRAENLQKWCDSEEGRLWAVKRGKEISAYALTEKGKLMRQDIGRQLHEHYKDPINSKNMSDVVKAWWNSLEGQEFNKQHHDYLREFYKTKEGQKVINEMRLKLIEKANTPERLEQASILATQRILSDKNNTSKIYHHGLYKSVKTNNEMYFRSSYELRYMICLDSDDNVSWYEYEPMIIKYDEYKRYIPDFLVNRQSDNELIEVKSKSLLNDPSIVRKCEIANEFCKENNMIYKFVIERDIKDYERSLNIKYNLWRTFLPINDKLHLMV
jgi:hypothetical protein